MQPRRLRVHYCQACLGAVLGTGLAQAAIAAGVGEGLSPPFVLNLGPGFDAGHAGLGQGNSASFTLNTGPGFWILGAAGIDSARSAAFPLALGKGFDRAVAAGVGTGSSSAFALYLGPLDDVFAVGRPFVLDTRAADPAPVTAPTDLTATSLCGSAIRLAWTDNSPDETGFEIDRKVADAISEPFFQVGVTTPNATYFYDHPQPGIRYSYRVRAARNLARSPYSHELTIEPGFGPGAPLPPASVTLRSLGDRRGLRVHILPPNNSWGGISKVHYEEYMASTNGFVAAAEDVPPSSGEAVFDGFVGDGGVSYFVRVTLVNECGQSSWPPVASESVAPQRSPVLFVHGIWGSASDWAPWLSYFDGRGFGHLGRMEFRCSGDTWEHWAAALSLQVHVLLGKNGDWRQHEYLDIVAHSQGGLAARSFVEESGGWRNVRRLFMLGTPNHGGNFAKLRSWLLKAPGFLPLPNALTDCTLAGQNRGPEDVKDNSKRLAQLNYPGGSVLDHACADSPAETGLGRRHQTRYYAVAGTASAGSCPLGPQGGLLGLVDLALDGGECQGDGVVDWKSVRIRSLSSEAGPCTQWLDTDLGSKGVGRLSHDGTTQAINFAKCSLSTPYKNSAPLMAFVADVLEGNDQSLPPCSSNGPPARVVQATGTSQLPALSDSYSDSLPPGGTRAHSVPVDSCSSLTVLLSWGADPLGITLQSPDSTIYFPSDTLTHSWLRYESDDSLGYAAFGVMSPQPGRWTLSVSGNNGSDPEPFAESWVVEGSPYELAAAMSNEQPSAGDTLVLRGTLSSADGPVSASITARIRAPDGSSANVPLSDAGGAGDSIPGDLTYGATYVVPPQDGGYDVTIAASVLAAASTSASRTAALAFSVFHRPDLALTEADVQAAPAVSAVTQLTEIRAVVHNLAAVPADSVDIRLTDLSTGDSLADFRTSIAGLDSEHVSTLWRPLVPGNHVIQTQASLVGLDDADLANDTASVIVPVGGSSATTGVGEHQNLTPSTFSLGAPRPNPFRANVTFDFTVPRASRVTLKIYDIQGRLVQRVVDDLMTPGRYSRTWSGSDERRGPAPPGVYFAHFTAPGFAATRRMVLLR